MKTQNKLIGAGLLASVAASFTCISTVLALVAGASGIATTFLWLEPFKPYLAGFTLLVLGIAWYQKLKSQKKAECKEKEDRKTEFFQSKKFLGLVTGFALLMLAFPHYAYVFYPKAEKQVVVEDQANVITAQFTINGLTPEGSRELNKEVIKLNGTIEASSCHVQENAIISFDKSQISSDKIKNALTAMGFTVTNLKME